LSRSAALVAAALVIVAAVLLVILREEGDPPKQAAPNAPNVIVIMTDDQALNTWSADVMPLTFERFESGTDFTQGFAVPPLCCPARATLMTGRYPQNHGVVTNRYNSLEDKDDVLPVWLSDAGYKTMIAGKFLNGYEKAKETNNGAEPAPGWDRWWISAGEERKYLDYEVSIDGELVPFGSEPEDYVTNAMTDASVEFMTDEAGGDSPYFLWMAHPAPHEASRDENPLCREEGPLPLPQDFLKAEDAELPTDPSFYEKDVSDKPSFIQRFPGRSKRAVERNELTYRCTVAALGAVDRSVDRVFETLEETGEADNTIVFFVSDNGTYFGEHRKPGGKQLPYDPSARVPFAVKLPDGRDAPRTSDLIVGLHDIAPTILDLAGLEGEHRTDGRSLVGPLRGQEEDWPQDRALVLEVGKEERCVGYHALRGATFLYTEYREQAGEECEVGFRELYDLRDDPLMLENLLAAPGVDPDDEARADELALRLAEVNACSGIEGRDPASSSPFCE